MSKLLILPANKAIRQNPNDPDKFPSFEYQELVPGVKQALEWYKAAGYTIAICENAGGVEKGITPLCEKLSEMIVLMTSLAPQIDYVMFSPDYSGAFAYLLSKPKQNAFPVTKRIRNQKVLSQTANPAPVYDESDPDAWQEVNYPSFRKPERGMLEYLVCSLQAEKIVAVWERDEDYDAIEAAKELFSIQRQSASAWKTLLNPDLDTQVTKRAVNFPTATPAPTDSRLQWRRFEFCDPSVNSDKFWEIRMTSDLLGYVVKHGRNGTAGKELLPKIFGSKGAATHGYESIINEKLSKRYCEIIPAIV